MPVDDITDARFFADNEIRKLVDEINREFRRIGMDSPFKDIDVSKGKELNKEVKEILTNANELNKIINQIKANSASVKGTGRRERELDAINNKTDELTNNLNILVNTFNEFQKAIENTSNNVRFAQQTIKDSETGKYQEGSLEQIGASVLSDKGVIENISQEVAEEVVRGVGKGLSEDLGGYIGENILKESVFNSVDTILSSHGVDVNKIISDGLGLNKDVSVDELISREVYSQLLRRGAPDDMGDPYSNTKLRDSYITYEDFREGVDNNDIVPMVGEHDKYVRYPKSNATGEIQYDSIDWRKTRSGYPQGWEDNPDIELGFPNTWGEGEYSAKSVFELMNRLKENYGEILEIANRAGIELPTAFTKILEWDENGDLSPFSKNIEILYDLLEGGKLDEIITQMNKTQWKTRLPESVFASDKYSFGWDKRDDLATLLGREVTHELKSGRKNVKNPSLKDVKTVNIEGQDNKFDEVKKDAVRLREIFNRFWNDTLIVGNTTSGTIRRALEGVKDLEKRKEIIEKLTGELFDTRGIDNNKTVSSFANTNKKLVESIPKQFLSGVVTLPGGKSFDIWNDLIYDTFSQELLEIDVNDEIMDEFKSAMGDYIRPRGYRKDLSEEKLKEIYKLENWKQTPTAEDMPKTGSFVGKHREVKDLTESFVKLVDTAKMAGIEIPKTYEELSEEITLLDYAGRLDDLNESITDLALKYTNLVRIIKEDNSITLFEDLENLFDLIRESNPQGWHPQISMKDAKGEDGYDETFNPGTMGLEKRGRKLVRKNRKKGKDGNWVEPNATILTNDTIDLTEPNYDPNAPVEDNSKILLDDNGLPVTKLNGQKVIVMSQEDIDELIKSKTPNMANSLVDDNDNGEGDDGEDKEDNEGLDAFLKAFMEFQKVLGHLQDVFDGLKIGAEEAMENLLKNLFVDKTKKLDDILKKVDVSSTLLATLVKQVHSISGTLRVTHIDKIVKPLADSVGREIRRGVMENLKDINIDAVIKPENLNLGDGAQVQIIYSERAFEGAGNVFQEGARPSFSIPNPFFDENGENVFLKMMREGFGVVDKTNDRTRKSYGAYAQWEDYDERIEKLEILAQSSNPEHKAFAEKALEVAKSMRDKGFLGRIRNQDLVEGLPDVNVSDLETFGFEDYAYFAEKHIEFQKRWNEVSHYTKKELDEKIKDIDKQIEEWENTRPSGDRGGKNNIQIKDEIRKLQELKHDLMKNYDKEFLEKEDLVYLEMLVKVYGTLRSRRVPFNNYRKKLDNYLKVVSNSQFEASKSIIAEIANIETNLNNLGIDVSDIASGVLKNANEDLEEYRKRLKSAKTGSEKRTLEKQIEAIELLIEHLESVVPDVEFNPVPNVSPTFSTFFPYMFRSVSSIEHTQEDPTLVEPAMKGTPVEGRESIVPHLVKKPGKVTSKYTYTDLFDLVPDDIDLEDDPSRVKHFSLVDLLELRFSDLSESYNDLKQQIMELQPQVTRVGVSKETIDSYEKLVERIKRVHNMMYELISKHPEYKDAYQALFKSMTEGYGDLTLSVEALTEKTKELDKATKSALGSLSKSDIKSMEALFGGTTKWDESTQSFVKKDDGISSGFKDATSDFEKFSRNFDYATRSVQGLQNGLITLFKIVGTGRVLSDMTTASSLRQTNKIMLSARRGQQEADKLYDKIQALVVELPGNDTFLTNILTMLGTMDKSLSGSDLEYMGGVIADYYMGAQAKGQFNNETERELRNYLMTGQTRNLTNSIIASEIESLKGLNSVKERTVALEKALQKTGMDSIAHYDSFTNTFEEFKGRFQKSFADLGDLYLGFVQILMKTYNFLDRISGSLLSQFTIIGGVGFLAITIVTMAFGRLLGAIGNVSNGIKSMRDFIGKELPEGTDRYTHKIQDLIRQLALKIGIIDADTYAQITNAKATDVQTVSTQLQTDAGAVNIEVKVAQTGANVLEAESELVEAEATDIETTAEGLNIWAKISNMFATIKKTIVGWAHTWQVYSGVSAESLEIIVENENTAGKIIARIAIMKQTIARALHTISVWIEEGSLWENTKATIINAWEKIKGALATAYDTAMKWADAIATNAVTIATWLLNGALAVLNFLLSPIGLVIIGIVIALYAFYNALMAVGNAFGWFDDFGSMVDAISAGLHRIWDAFVGSEQVQYAMYIIGGFIENVKALFSDIGGGLMEAIFGTNGSREWDIVANIIDVLGAIGGFLWWLSPLDEILEVIRAIGAYIGWVMTQWNKFIDSAEFGMLIDDFKEIWDLVGQVWNELKPLFEETWNAIAEMFSSGESSPLGEDGDELFEMLKDIAQFIHDYIIPILKVTIPLGVKFILGLILVVFKIVQVIVTIVYQAYQLIMDIASVIAQIGGVIWGTVGKVVAIVYNIIGAIVDKVNWVVEKVQWLADKFGWLFHWGENDNKPTNIANQEGGYNTKITQQYADSLRNGKDLAKRYIHNNPQSTIINNNFAEGSVQPDARNMTKKEIRQMFTSAFGYNQARGVNGIVR